MQMLEGQAMGSAPHADHTEATEIILKALAEGGSLTLIGIRVSNGWRFRLVRDESTLADLLCEEDRHGIEFRSESDWVDSWQEALKLLDEYPWHRLHAEQVHPDFRREIWAAVQHRAARKGRPEDRRVRWQLDRWQRVCHGEPPFSGDQITLPLR
jgi:hypothetical protein